MKFRLSSLLVLVPLLAIVMAMGVWVQTLREQVTLLETRVATLERNQPILPWPVVSSVGVPLDVDEAMQMDMRGIRRRLQ